MTQLVLDYARISLVVEERRSVLLALFRALGFVKDHRRPVLGLFLLLAAGHPPLVPCLRLAGPRSQPVHLDGGPAGLVPGAGLPGGAVGLQALVPGKPDPPLCFLPAPGSAGRGVEGNADGGFSTPGNGADLNPHGEQSIGVSPGAFELREAA